MTIKASRCQDGTRHDVDLACAACDGGRVTAAGPAVGPPWPIVMYGLACDRCDATYTVEIFEPSMGGYEHRIPVDDGAGPLTLEQCWAFVSEDNGRRRG